MYLDDLLEIYNSLVNFNDLVIKNPTPKPIRVSYESNTRLLVFELGGKTVRLFNAFYFCFALDDLEKTPTYLLPEDYDYLMSTLQTLINGGEMIKEKTLISPTNYGFDVLGVNQISIAEANKGLQILGSIRFISGLSWWFRFKVKRKYGL